MQQACLLKGLKIAHSAHLKNSICKLKDDLSIENATALSGLSETFTLQQQLQV